MRLTLVWRRSLKSTAYYSKCSTASCLTVLSCTGLDEALVNELAYQLFLSTCGYDCSPENLQAIRRHLQVCSALSLAKLMYPACWLPNEAGHTKVESHISF